MQRRTIYHAVAFSFFLLMGVKQHRARMNIYNRENVDILHKHLIDKSCEKFIDDTRHLNIIDDSVQHMLFCCMYCLYYRSRLIINNKYTIIIIKSL